MFLLRRRGTDWLWDLFGNFSAVLSRPSRHAKGKQVLGKVREKQRGIGIASFMMTSW